MPKILSENSYTIMGTHYMVNDLDAHTGGGTYAVAPTQFDERHEGYDARVRSVKLLMFQYKRPVQIQRGLRYYLNPLQIATLRARALPSRSECAYFCFPTLLYENDIARAVQNGTVMDQTLFVPARQMRPDFLRIVVEGGGIFCDAVAPEVRLNPEPWSQILARTIRCDRRLRYQVREGERFVKTPEGRAFDRVGELLQEASDRFARLVKMRDFEGLPGLLDSVGSGLLDATAEWASSSEIEALLDVWSSELEYRLARNRRVDLQTAGIRNAQFHRVHLRG